MLTSTPLDFNFFPPPDRIFLCSLGCSEICPLTLNSDLPTSRVPALRLRATTLASLLTFACACHPCPPKQKPQMLGKVMAASCSSQTQPCSERSPIPYVMEYPAQRSEDITHSMGQLSEDRQPQRAVTSPSQNQKLADTLGQTVS